MALTIGNKTANLATPAATTQTFSHNQSIGADNYLFIIVAVSTGIAVTGVTYDGDAMTEVSSNLTTDTNSDWYIFELENPSTGSNTVELTFGSELYNPVSSYAISASDCAGSGNIVFDQSAISPNSGSITVSADSIIFGALIAGSADNQTIVLDGSSRTLEYTHNINNRTAGAFSTAGLLAGSKTTSVTANSTVSGLFLEIQQAGGGSPGGSSGNFLMMF